MVIQREDGSTSTLVKGGKWTSESEDTPTLVFDRTFTSDWAVVSASGGPWQVVMKLAWNCKKDTSQLIEFLDNELAAFSKLGWARFFIIPIQYGEWSTKDSKAILMRNGGQSVEALIKLFCELNECQK